MFLLVLVVLVMFFHVLGSCQTLVLKRYISVIGMYEKRGTSLFLLDSSHIHTLFIYSNDEGVFNIVFSYDVDFANLGIFRKKAREM